MQNERPQVIALILDGTLQFRIAQYQDSITLTNRLTILCQNTEHAARLTGIDPQRADRLYKTFHIDVLKEWSGLGFSDLYLIFVDAQT